MIRRYKKYKRDERRAYRVNERIFAQTLRVLDAEGKQIGVLKRDEALKLAQDKGLDIVEIAPKAVPPVAKIIDFNKFLYQLTKKKREEKKKSKQTETKEIRLGPFMKDNDLSVMVRRAEEFLEDGDKVKLVVRFAGRQITHPEFGENVIRKAADALYNLSKIEREPHLEGRQMIAILAPERKTNAKEKDKEISKPQV